MSTKERSDLPKWAEEALDAKYTKLEINGWEGSALDDYMAGAEYGIRLVLDRLEKTKDNDIRDVEFMSERDHNEGRQSVREEVLSDE